MSVVLKDAARAEGRARGRQPPPPHRIGAGTLRDMRQRSVT
jgi:hypothetical protein